MSREDVEIVRQAWKAYSERGVDAVLDYFAEDCVCENLPEGPDSATAYAGREGVRERDELFAEIWGDLVIEPVEFIDAGEDVVVTVTSMRGRGKGSGAPFDAPIAFVTELRDGKVVRDRPFPSRDEALEAAGLRE
jgi:ketosteroid isomerase-like protein